MAAKIRIILVEPREGGNVGAVARAMKNFALDDLWVVGEVPPLQPVAEWWASGAGDLLKKIQRAASLEDALADVQLSVATTSSRGRVVEAPLTPRHVRELAEGLGGGKRLAIVFGREDRGLTADEAAICSHIAIVPTNPEFPTMNLAQSVAVFAYEASLSSAATPVAASRDLAPHALLERLHERAASLLLEVGFLHENNPERIYNELRNIVARASLDRREAEILLGITKQVEWKLRSTPERERR